MNNKPYIYKINNQKNKINCNTIFFQEKVLCSASKEIIKLVKKRNEKIYKQNQRIQELQIKANYDQLTGLLNRHGLKKEIKEKFKNGENISLIVFDIIKLSIINNKFGYNYGDEAIIQTAELLKNYFRQDDNRESDIVCRYGGDEFIIIGKQINKVVLENKRIELSKELEKIRKNDNKKYILGLHIFQIENYTIDNFKIATNEGLLNAKNDSNNNIKKFTI